MAPAARPTAAPAPHAVDLAAPLVEELSPRPDSWDVFVRLAHLPRPLFLDSAPGHPGLDRYSFITADPTEWVESHHGRTVVAPARAVPEEGDPFDVLAERLRRFRTEPVPGLPPFHGGAAGLFGYDLCHHLERLPRFRVDEFRVPELAVGLYDWVVAFDHAAGRAWLVSTGFPEVEPGARRRRAERRLRHVRRILTGPPPSRDGAEGTSGSALPLAHAHPVRGRADLFSSFDRAGYLRAVRRAIEYIHAGDCFQVNLAQRLVRPAALPPVELYRRLRERNPAPFAGYFDLGDFVVATASPERFVRIDAAGGVETRPIKGTRPRGRTPDEDRAQAEALVASPKDRAENVMIVDLLRNDLGRICRYRSVRVEAVCRLETFPFVHHLVSEVRGRLREGLGAVDWLRATFPGGSVTGAPKVRAMEIIAELEPTARGPYCGCLGYLGFDGSADTNILIRTFTAGRGWVQFPVGGGVVADSDPEQEYEETWHKAAGLLRVFDRR